jgi:ribosomal protein S28E/S33
MNGEDTQRIIDEIENKLNHPVFVGNMLMTMDKERSRNI